MVSGNQKVKTPTGQMQTRGAWVKTGPSTWKDVDQIYVKTPTGWNNASGQAIVQSLTHILQMVNNHTLLMLNNLILTLQIVKRLYC